MSQQVHAAPKWRDYPRPEGRLFFRALIGFLVISLAGSGAFWAGSMYLEGYRLAMFVTEDVP